MMNKTEIFWDNRASNFERKPIKDELAFRNTVEKVKNYLTATDTVLDYACGTGTLSNLLAENVKEIHAIDILSKMIAFATEKAAALKIDNIQHSKNTLFDKELDNAQYDVVLAFNILHLSEDMQDVIKRISQMLKPEGLLISYTPCLSRRLSFMGIVDFFLGRLGIVPNLNVSPLSVSSKLRWLELSNTAASNESLSLFLARLRLRPTSHDVRIVDSYTMGTCPRRQAFQGIRTKQI